MLEIQAAGKNSKSSQDLEKTIMHYPDDHCYICADTKLKGGSLT